MFFFFAEEGGVDENTGVEILRSRPVIFASYEN
jgi:hypothetical protein